MIEYKQVSKSYGAQQVLKNVTIKVRSGELFVLVGPSGGGKTTLLQMINRLVTPTTGEIRVFNHDVAHEPAVAKLRQRIGYVLQTPALFPHLSAFENAALPLTVQKVSAAQKRTRISALFKQVGLAPDQFMERYPHELSGGEAQRVGIVRALATQPQILLFDEPFSALDPVTRAQLQQLVLQLHRKLSTTIMFVTHDLAEATLLAERMAVIGEGTVQQIGTPAAIMATPANKFVRAFCHSAHNQPIYLATVVERLNKPVCMTATARTLPPTATLAQWARLLQTNPNQVISVAGVPLTATDFWNFMALGEEQSCNL